MSKIFNKFIRKKATVLAATNVGKIRKNNEDNYYLDYVGIREEQNENKKFSIQLSEKRIFAVFDGMGGEALGEEASKIAAKELEKASSKIEKTKEANLDRIIDEYASKANDKICEMVEDQKCGLSGTTMALVCIKKNNVFAFSVGDSRIYHFDGKELVLITEDQTLAMKKLRANIYTEEEAKNSEDANKITYFLGIDDIGKGIVTKKYKKFSVTKNSMIIICSDGLTDMCDEDEIKKVVKVKEGNVAEKLVEQALKNGGVDNVSCVIISDFS